MSAATGKAYRKRYPWHDLYRMAKRRCNETKHRSFRYYGGLGIKFKLTMFDVCLLCLRDGAFDMKIPSLDRKDAIKDYEYDNCRIIEKDINCRIPHNPDLAAEWTD